MNCILFKNIISLLQEELQEEIDKGSTILENSSGERIMISCSAIPATKDPIAKQIIGETKAKELGALIGYQCDDWILAHNFPDKQQASKFDVWCQSTGRETRGVYPPERTAFAGWYVQFR